MKGDGKQMANNDKVPELSKNEFDEFIGKGIVVIDFFAEWCMPCLMMAPVIDELSEKFKGKIKFGKINVDDNQQLAGKFGVSSIPNFIVFKDGEKIKQFVGGISSEDFEERLREFL
jgi:thioredoxin 1